ncbi:hypothetical protein GGR52DRAFT_576640 [Hypoxylon sp. FL1284]|nr:hypothetical protein GGR52DRAFT_576640 [Hypoxylon sp. FL1284]
MRSLGALILSKTLALVGVRAADDALNCTGASYTSPGWTIPALATTRVGGGDGPVGSIYFSADHHATNRSTVCSAEGWLEAAAYRRRQEDEIIWYDCASPGMRFRFDFAASGLTLQANWTCADSPTVEFSAIGNITVPSGPPCPETGEGEPDCVPRNMEVEAVLTSWVIEELVSGKLLVV